MTPIQARFPQRPAKSRSLEIERQPTLDRSRNLRQNQHLPIRRQYGLIALIEQVGRLHHRIQALWQHAPTPQPLPDVEGQIGFLWHRVIGIHLGQRVERWPALLHPQRRT